MANRHIISGNERVSLVAEQEFWTLTHDLLVKDFFDIHRNVTFVMWPEGGLLSTNWRSIYFPYSSTQRARSQNQFGNIHWICHYQLEGIEHTDDYFLVATGQTLKLHVAKRIAELILNGNVQNGDDAIALINQWQIASTNESDWDMQFHNKPIGAPYPWSIVNGLRFLGASEPLTMEHVISKRFATGQFIELLNLWQLRKQWETTNPEWQTVLTQPRISTARHETVRDDIVRRLVFIHTAASMYARSIPLMQGAHHVNTNDAPSHGSIRHMIVLRIRELWPAVYAATKHLLPMTIQRRIQATIMKNAIAAVPVASESSLTTEEIAAHNLIAPKKSKIVIPDDDASDSLLALDNSDSEEK